MGSAKIVKMQSYVQLAKIVEEDLKSMTTFSIKKMYLMMRGDFPKVQWRKMVCNNYGSPKGIFIFRLAAHGRLPTKDRLMNWGIVDNQICPLCASQTESISHLFFQCEVSAQVWNSLLQWQQIARKNMSWPEEQKWAEIHANGRSLGAELYRMTLAACVYHLWIERNQRVYQAKHTDHRSIVRRIIQEVFYRGSQRSRLIKELDKLNCYP